MKSDTCPKCGGPKRGPAYDQCRKCFLEHYKTRTTKLCRKCNRELPLSAFRTRPEYCTSYGTRRPRSRCKECEAVYAKERLQKNPEKRKELKRRYKEKDPARYIRLGKRRSWKRLGLDPDIVESYVNTHPDACEICGMPSNGQKLAIDHCHDKGVFRGILCSKCNMGIGLFQDDPLLLTKAIEYLNRGPISQHIQGPRHE